MKKRKIYEILITERERIISFMDSLMKCDDGYIHAIIILDGNVVPIGVSSDDYKNKNFDYDIILWSDYHSSTSNDYHGHISNAENEYHKAVRSICYELDDIKMERFYSASGINRLYNNLNQARFTFFITEHGLLVPTEFRTPFDKYPAEGKARTPFDDYFDDERIY